MKGVGYLGGIPKVGYTPSRKGPCGQTDTCENITFPQLRWRAVKTKLCNKDIIVVKCERTLRARSRIALLEFSLNG